MCNLRKFVDNVFVADIKYDFILNIVSQAKKCNGIDRIVLFGSSIKDSCRDDSDIDIAVFGSKKKTEYLKSKEFKDFHRNVFLYRNEVGQDYDILYFVTDKEYKDEIINEINNGSVIYRRFAV